MTRGRCGHIDRTVGLIQEGEVFTVGVSRHIDRLERPDNLDAGTGGEDRISLTVAKTLDGTRDFSRVGRDGQVHGHRHFNQRGRGVVAVDAQHRLVEPGHQAGGVEVDRHRIGAACSGGSTARRDRQPVDFGGIVAS